MRQFFFLQKPRRGEKRKWGAKRKIKEKTKNETKISASKYQGKADILHPSK